MSRKKNIKKKKITSGDRLVDWLFNRLIDVTNKRVSEVSCKKLMKRKPEKIGKLYYGKGELGGVFLDNEYNKENEIEIEYRISKRTKGRVFMHELSHILFNKSIGIEKQIRQFENYLWPRLCEEQKQLLIKKLYLLKIKPR